MRSVNNELTVRGQQAAEDTRKLREEMFSAQVRSLQRGSAFNSEMRSLNNELTDHGQQAEKYDSKLREEMFSAQVRALERGRSIF